MSSAIFTKPLPYIALLIAHLIWGANFVVAKITLSEFPPMSLAFARFAFACLLISPFLLSLPKKQRKIKPDHIPKLLAAGLFLITINIALFYEGLTRTTAINASALTLIIPIISVLISWWFLKEKIYWINFLGVFAGLLGAVVIIGLPLILVGGFSKDALLGNLLIILSSICFVIGAILSKQTLKTYPPLVVIAVMLAVGAVTFFIPALFDYFQNPVWVEKISILGTLGFLYITILSTVCALFLMEWGLAKIDVVQTNLFTYIEPGIAATLAVFFLGERISFSFIIGICLVILGVYWGTLGKIHHHHITHKHHRR